MDGAKPLDKSQHCAYLVVNLDATAAYGARVGTQSFLPTLHKWQDCIKLPFPIL